jgi:hypothetical protein
MRMNKKGVPEKVKVVKLKKAKSKAGLLKKAHDYEM